jgi:hypothetical protein
MVRRVAFAHLGTSIAEVRAELCEWLGLGWVASDEFRHEETEVRAITAESNAPAHQIIMLVIVVVFHADHVVRAGLADLRASGTGLKAMLLLWGEGRVVHIGSFRSGRWSFPYAPVSVLSLSLF